MIRKTCLVLFLILILVSANFGAEEKRANVVLRKEQSIFIEGKEIELVDYKIVDAKYEVMLRVDGKNHTLKEGESLNIGFEITFIGRWGGHVPPLSLAFISLFSVN